MPRSKSDVKKDIGRIKSGDSGVFTYSGGKCINCDSSVSGEKTVDIYDICWDCYNNKSDRVVSLIKELERL